MALEELSFESVNGQTHGWTDDGQKVITIAHLSIAQVSYESARPINFYVKKCFTFFLNYFTTNLAEKNEGISFLNVKIKISLFFTYTH